MFKNKRKIMILMVVAMMVIFATTTNAASDVNLAPKSTVTGSSSFAPEYDVKLAVDGIKGEFQTGEWASLGETEPWVKLEWKTPVTLDKVVLLDRENTLDNAMGGTLTFSDGSKIDVTGIDTTKTEKAVTFDKKTVTWVQFNIKGEGANVGLSEIEAYGTEGATAAKDTSADEKDTSESNPKTGDVGVTMYALTAGVAGVGILLAKKKRK